MPVYEPPHEVNCCGGANSSQYQTPSSHCRLCRRPATEGPLLLALFMCDPRSH